MYVVGEGGRNAVSGELGRALNPLCRTPQAASPLPLPPGLSVGAGGRGGDPSARCGGGWEGGAPFPVASLGLDSQRKTRGAAAGARQGRAGLGALGAPCGAPGPPPAGHGQGRSWRCCLCWCCCSRVRDLRVSSGASSCGALGRALTLEAQILQGEPQIRAINDRVPNSILFLRGPGQEKKGVGNGWQVMEGRAAGWGWGWGLLGW